MKTLLFIFIGAVSFLLVDWFTREPVQFRRDWYVVDGGLQSRVVRCDGGGKA